MIYISFQFLKFQMSIAASASRFSCLPDDDAADWKGPKTKVKAKKEKTPEPNKQKDAVKVKAKNEAKELQNLAFGGQKKSKKKKSGVRVECSIVPEVAATNGTGSPSPAPVPAITTAQFQEWKDKDKVVSEDHFNSALQEAIIQSKLEFEQQQAVQEAQQQLLAAGKAPQELIASLSKEDRKKAKQQLKPQPMSLQEFQEPVVESSKPTEPAPVYRHPR